MKVNRILCRVQKVAMYECVQVVVVICVYNVIRRHCSNVTGPR